MHDRILELAEGPVFLRIRNRLLEIHVGDERREAIPPDDLAALLVGTAKATLTAPVLSALADAGVAVTICDREYLPAAVLLPLRAHVTQTGRYAAQTALTLPRRKRAWQAVVRCQIALRTELLERHKEDADGLRALVARVRSGDPDNTEAHAAQVFWRQFMGRHFRRDREALDANRYLNYGYTILRSLVARAICAAGLHPSFGIHHRNAYDPFTLAEDLCEPFRPCVEAVVREVMDEYGDEAPMTAPLRAKLLGVVSRRLRYANGAWALPDAARRLATSYARIVEDKDDELDLPLGLGEADNGNG